MDSIKKARDWYPRAFVEITTLPRKVGVGGKIIKAKNGSNTRRYFAALDDAKEWRPELAEYNGKFSRTEEIEEMGKLFNSLNGAMSSSRLPCERKQRAQNMFVSFWGLNVTWLSNK